MVMSILLSISFVVRSHDEQIDFKKDFDNAFDIGLIPLLGQGIFLYTIYDQWDSMTVKRVMVRCAGQGTALVLYFTIFLLVQNYYGRSRALAVGAFMTSLGLLTFEREAHKENTQTTL